LGVPRSSGGGRRSDRSAGRGGPPGRPARAGPHLHAQGVPPVVRRGRRRGAHAGRLRIAARHVDRGVRVRHKLMGVVATRVARGAPGQLPGMGRLHAGNQKVRRVAGHGRRFVGANRMSGVCDCDASQKTELLIIQEKRLGVQLSTGL